MRIEAPKRPLTDRERTDRLERNVGLGVDEWTQPSGAHDAYPEGARVYHDGSEWEAIHDDAVHEPGVSGWRRIGPAMPDLRERVAKLADIYDDLGDDGKLIVDTLLGRDTD